MRTIFVKYKEEKKELNIKNNIKYDYFKNIIRNNFFDKENFDLPSFFEFNYIDEENDKIRIDSEEEWKLLVHDYGSENQKNENDDIINKKEIYLELIETQPPRISLPFEKLKRHYEYIVVGKILIKNNRFRIWWRNFCK
jgi:hypothetical protein